MFAVFVLIVAATKHLARTSIQLGGVPRWGGGLCCPRFNLHKGKRSQGSLFGMTSDASRLRLQRLDAPTAHAWRRGWAVQALSNGVSETFIRVTAGWSSGALVARYTRALAGELAIEEFQRSWKALSF